MKKLFSGLLPRVLAAIALGIACGNLLPGWCVRVFITFNGIFGQLLGFAIPLIIVGLVAPAIAEIGRGAGRMLALTAAMAYSATVAAGFVAYITGALAFPPLITSHVAIDAAAGSDGLPPYFAVEITPLMGVTTALVLAFVAGLGMAHLRGDVLRRGAGEFRDIMTMFIERVILPLLPLYIFGIFMNMTAAGEVFRVLGVFIRIIGVIFLLHIAWLLLLYSAAGAVARRNPLRMLWRMMPAYFTALGTQSSAATIPVTLEQTRRMGVDGRTAGFVIPLCATIHLSGSMLKIVACAMALMIMQGMDYDLRLFAGFIFMLGITMVAAPGVPGGAIMAALGVLASMLGFSQADQALMISLYIAMDSFGTACNVTGDGALAVIIDRMTCREGAAGPHRN